MRARSTAAVYSLCSRPKSCVVRSLRDHTIDDHRSTFAPASSRPTTMKRSLLALAIVILAGSAALAQRPMATLQTPQPAGNQAVKPNVSLPAVTPEVWIYSQQLQRHDDPAQ